MSDLHMSAGSVLRAPSPVNVEFALSALRGIEQEGDRGLGGVSREKIEVNEWNKISKAEFFKTNRKAGVQREKKEVGNKGMPDPYYINNIKDDMRGIKLYYSNDEQENKEFIYKGQYIPRIYRNWILVCLISLAYILSIQILLEGFVYGKNMAKQFVPSVSTLFVFFLSLKFLMALLPVGLSALICLIITYSFNQVSMENCEMIPIFKNTRIHREPIGWLCIICFHSLLIGNILYHCICNVAVLNLLTTYLKSNVLMYGFYLIVLLLLTTIIFVMLTASIFPARKTQNFVFSFISAYLLLSAYSYLHNLVLLQFFRNTNIFQIEPMMFFAYKPKFILNHQNSIALAGLVLLTAISLLMPKWIKKISNALGMKKRGASKNPSRYDLFLNIWT